jgi:hypothetical protein
MRKLFRILPMIALLAAPLHVYGGTTATMQVSFTILASCTVDAHGVTAPAVQCAQAGGYIVAPQAASMHMTGNDATGWTVYF